MSAFNSKQRTIIRRLYVETIYIYISYLTSTCGICKPTKRSNVRVCADPNTNASRVILYAASTTSLAFSTSPPVPIVAMKADSACDIAPAAAVEVLYGMDDNADVSASRVLIPDSSIALASMADFLR